MDNLFFLSSYWVTKQTLSAQLWKLKMGRGRQLQNNRQRTDLGNLSDILVSKERGNTHLETRNLSVSKQNPMLLQH